MTTETFELVPVRYLVDDVQAAVEFYRDRLDFVLDADFAPAFASVRRGRLQLLLSGPASSAARPMPDGAVPEAGGWNRVQILVDDLEAEVKRLRSGGADFRNDIVDGPGGRQILLRDPSGNFVELFQPAARPPRK